MEPTELSAITADDIESRVRDLDAAADDDVQDDMVVEVLEARPNRQDWLRQAN
jgi:hypothetical protein